MTLVTLPGPGPYYPPIPPFRFGNLAAMHNNFGPIDATGEKLAMSGYVSFAERTGTKDIETVGVLFGTVTKAGGSGLTLSLQDVSLTAGPPMQPDEVQDQTAAIANGDATFVTGAFHLATLSANRTVTHRDLLSIVLEYDGGGRLGADIVSLSQWTEAHDTQRRFQLVNALKTAGWAAAAGSPIVLLGFTDGTFGTLSGCWPCSAHNTVSLNTGSNPNEYALPFQVPFSYKTDGGWFAAFFSASAEAEVILYDDTTPMTNGTLAIDLNTIREAGQYRVLEADFAEEIALEINHTYTLALKPTTTNSIVIPGLDVSAAGHMMAVPGGQNFNSASRQNAEAWIALATRRPFMGIRISSLDNGGGSSGPAPVYGE